MWGKKRRPRLGARARDYSTGATAAQITVTPRQTMEPDWRSVGTSCSSRANRLGSGASSEQVIKAILMGPRRGSKKNSDIAMTGLGSDGQSHQRTQVGAGAPRRMDFSTRMPASVIAAPQLSAPT